MTQRRRRAPRTSARPEAVERPESRPESRSEGGFPEPGDRRARPVPFDWLEAFVGFPLSTAVANGLLELQRRLEKRRAEDGYEVRWIKATTFYVNLRQVGPVLRELFEPLSERLAARLAELSPFSLRVERLTVHPSAQEPLAIRAELGGDDAELARAREAVEEVLDEFGIPLPEQIFAPHVTIGLLGRLDDVGIVERRIAELPGNVASRFRVGELHFQVRALSGGGEATYETAIRAELSRAGLERRQAAPAAEDEGPFEDEPRPVATPERESRHRDPELDRPSFLPRERPVERQEAPDDAEDDLDPALDLVDDEEAEG